MAGNRITDDLLLTTLTLSKNIAECSKTLGISEQAIYQRLKKDKIKLRYEELNNSKFKIADMQLSNILSKAILTLNEILDSETTTPNLKLKTAQIIINNSLKIKEQNEIINRLINIEKKLVD